MYKASRQSAFWEIATESQDQEKKKKSFFFRLC